MSASTNLVSTEDPQGSPATRDTDHPQPDPVRKRISIPPTTVEQRTKIYEDLRSLLSPGFITISVQVGKISLSLRSLSAQDYSLLHFRVAGAKERWKIWAVSSSIWMIDGQVLGSDQSALMKVYRQVSMMPATVQSFLYRIVLGLAKRVQTALEVMESYLYEDESRDLWKSEGPDACEMGWGLDWKMGHNYVQRYWILYNRVEDMREQRNWEWQMVKFQVSAHAPKGIKKLNEKDQRQEHELQVRRRRTQDLVYFESLGLIPKVSGRLRKDSLMSVRKAESFEELQEEMKMWVEGKKDSHDEIVESIKNRIREQVEARKQQEKERIEAIRELAREEELPDQGKFLMLSGEEASKYREQLIKKAPPQVFSQNTHNSAYDKYIAAKLMAGNIRVDERGNLHGGMEIESAELRDEEESKVNPSILQDLIDRRRPQIE